MSYWRLDPLRDYEKSVNNGHLQNLVLGNRPAIKIKKLSKNPFLLIKEVGLNILKHEDSFRE